MAMGNKLICLLGGAAVGKDTIRNKLLEKHEDLMEATSHTTRPMRATENGSEYYFIQEEEFHAMYENGEFLETRTYEIEVPDTDEKVLWYYGYSLEEISKKLQQGNILMIVDLEGFKEFKEIYQKDCIGIYIDVDRDIRVQRYLNRDEINYQNVKECIRRIDDDDNRAFKGYEEWVDWKITPTNSDEAAGAISVIIYGKGEK